MSFLHIPFGLRICALLRWAFVNPKFLAGTALNRIPVPFQPLGNRLSMAIPNPLVTWGFLPTATPARSCQDTHRRLCLQGPQAPLQPLKYSLGVPAWVEILTALYGPLRTPYGHTPPKCAEGNRAGSNYDDLPQTPKFSLMGVLLRWPFLNTQVLALRWTPQNPEVSSLKGAHYDGSSLTLKFKRKSPGFPGPSWSVLDLL